MGDAGLGQRFQRSDRQYRVLRLMASEQGQVQLLIEAAQRRDGELQPVKAV